MMTPSRSGRFLHENAGAAPDPALRKSRRGTNFSAMQVFGWCS